MKIKFIQDLFNSINGKNRYNNIIDKLGNLAQKQAEISDYIQTLQESLNNNIQTQQACLNDIQLIKKYMNISNIIDFSSYGQNIHKKGFYESENWGAWLQQDAEVTFKALTIDNDISFDIFLNILGTGNKKKLDIYVNNNHLTTVSSVNPNVPVSVTISKDLIKQDNIIKMKFISHGTVSLSSLNISSDTRKLAFGIVKIISNVPVITAPFENDKEGFIKHYNCDFNNEMWDDYLNTHDTEELLKNLKAGVENSDLFGLLYRRRTNSYTFNSYEENLHNKILEQDLSKYQITDKTGFQPEVFYFKNGLSFLDENIVKKHLANGCVIDGGACTGDSALMFSEYDFVDKIYSFEPCKTPYLNLKNTLELNNCNKAEAINTGLSGEDGEVDILGEKCQITTIDTFAKDKKVGCIKLDIEGLELSTIKGAVETIKRDCPILLICLYHTPQDFFEIKPFLESLNLGYKFKVVNTEPCNYLIGVHLVLIAYKEDWDIK